MVTAVNIHANATNFAAIDELRYRTLTDLPRVPDTPRFASSHHLLPAVPTLFWAGWAFRLDTGDLPWMVLRQLMSRLVLTIGNVMVTWDLERRLHTTTRSQEVAAAANDLRKHPNWGDIVTAMLRLHDYLQSSGAPIDYQRRRDLDYDGPRLETRWMDLVTECGMDTTAKTTAAARLWLIERLSCAPVPNPRGPGHVHTRGVSTDRVRRTLTPQLVAALDTFATEFLAANGIVDEPLTWEPPVTILDGLALPGTPPEDLDPSKIHQLMAAGLTVPQIARHLDASVSKVRHQLEHHPSPVAWRPRWAR